MSKSKIIRQKIWSRLAHVAKPDTRFQRNVAEVIPDFDGSETATDHLVTMPAYDRTSCAFITPDNCFFDLRRRMIAAGKPFVMSNYGIYRGFLLIEPGMVPPGGRALRRLAGRDGAFRPPHHAGGNRPSRAV